MARKQGETEGITQKEAPEFKGANEEVKKDVKLTSVITMGGNDGKPVHKLFEDGKLVKTENLK